MRSRASCRSVVFRHLNPSARSTLMRRHRLPHVISSHLMSHQTRPAVNARALEHMSTDVIGNLQDLVDVSEVNVNVYVIAIFRARIFEAHFTSSSTHPPSARPVASPTTAASSHTRMGRSYLSPINAGGCFLQRQGDVSAVRCFSFVPEDHRRRGHGSQRGVGQAQRESSPA